MDDLKIKFNGAFTLEDSENSTSHKIPIQVLYHTVNKQHFIFIYDYKKTVMPPWVDAIITGVITHFDLKPIQTKVCCSECHLLGPGEEEPDGFDVYTVSYSWNNNTAIVQTIRKWDHADN